MIKTLYLITNFYPYGNTSEVPFLTNELPYLNRKFQKIILVPQYINTDGELIDDKYPVDLSLAREILKRNWKALNLLFTKPVFLEIIKMHDYRKLRKLWRSLNTIANVGTWIKQKLISTDPAVFYTYWLTDITTGLAFINKEGRSALLISRAHGYDLYEERTSHGYFPLREFTLNHIERLFLISQNGFDYMCKKYPQFSKKYEISKLGVKVKETTLQISTNTNSIRLASCAYLRQVKRIELLAEAIGKFATSHAEQKIFWDHFGGGDEQIKRQIQMRTDDFPDKVICSFWGDVPNEVILGQYRKMSYDFFVSVSESEGIPVSIMEAMSNGIPTIATTVGGVSEIVNNENGYLLRPDPTPDEISEKIWSAFLDKTEMNAKKEICRKFILEHYNAERNYPRFMDKIQSIVDNFYS